MVKPADIFEKIWVADVVYLSWEVMRYRKLKTSLIEATQQQALDKVLRPLIYGNLDRQPPDGDSLRGLTMSELLAQNYVLKDEAAVKQVDHLLKTAGLTSDAITAEAFAMRGADLERIEHVIATAERRRNATIQHIESRREYFAERLRHAATQIEATGLRVIEDKSSNARKAA